MAIAIYEATSDGRHHWAEAMSPATLRNLASGEWVLFDATPATPPPHADPLDYAVSQLLAPGSTSATAVAGRAAFESHPALASAATVYVDPVNGDDGPSPAPALFSRGVSWAVAFKTIPAAIAGLGSAGGTVDMGAGGFNVASTGRRDTCTFAAGSSTVTDASITAGDVGSYVISPYLRSPLVIETVNAGVSFTVTDQTGAAVTPESSGTSLAIITKPAIVVPPGVRLRGQGSEWASDQSAQTGVLNKANTWITDSGTGITVLCGHPRDAGVGNSGQQVSGVWLEGFAIKGNANSLFGLAQINNWTVVAQAVDSVGHGMGGLLVAANANQTRFSDCRFGGNGAAASTVVTGGVVVLENVPPIPFGPVKFDNCFFTGNYGWNIVGTNNFTTGKGARSVRVSQGQFNNCRPSTLASSGTHVAISGSENRSLLDDCIFESADFLHVDVYDAPVTAIACKFKATGGTLGTLAYAVRVNTGATFDATGCGFLDSTAYHVQVASGATFNWHSCYSPAGIGSSILAADTSGNALAMQSSAGLAAGSTSGSTAQLAEPLNGMAGSAMANETCSRLLVNSSAVAVANQTLNLTYFTATRSATVSQIVFDVGATASGGSATYIGAGLYRVNSDNSLTLIGQSNGANANAFTSANASGAGLNLTASARVVQGQRYAIGVLVNSANTLPTFRGVQSASLAMSWAPVLTHTVASQTALPATVAAGSLVAGGSFIHSRLS